MNLEIHKLINQFWQLRRSKRITSKQADLYFFLIQECNMKFWENPFECSNKLIIASIDMQEPTLIDARNRLKQLGLIDFQSGKRNESSPIYRIGYLNNLRRNRDESIDESIDETEMKAPPINKTKTKPNQTSKSHSGGKPPAAPKKIVEPFWEKLVETWFVFYGEKFTNEGQPSKPVFNAAQAENLKKIVGYLKKVTQRDWTDEYSCHCLKRFFEKAYNHDQWMKDNFELGNMLKKYNSITNTSKDGTATNRPVNGKASRADDLRSGQDSAAELLRESLDQFL